MPSSHLILCVPFSCPQSFPASGSFPVGQLFASGGHRTGVSASASASNEYSGLISLRMDLLGLCIPRDSQESSPTPQFKSLNSLALSFLYGPTLTSTRDSWKNYSLTRWTFVGKAMSLLSDMLCRFVAAFLPRSTRPPTLELTISWDCVLRFTFRSLCSSDGHRSPEGCGPRGPESWARLSDSTTNHPPA